MNTFGFLFDEHIALVLRDQLAILEPGLRLYAIGLTGAPPKTTPDPDYSGGSRRTIACW